MRIIELGAKKFRGPSAIGFRLSSHLNIIQAERVQLDELQQLISGLLFGRSRNLHTHGTAGTLRFSRENNHLQESYDLERTFLNATESPIRLFNGQTGDRIGSDPISNQSFLKLAFGGKAPRMSVEAIDRLICGPSHFPLSAEEEHNILSLLRAVPSRSPDEHGLSDASRRLSTFFNDQFLMSRDNRYSILNQKILTCKKREIELEIELKKIDAKIESLTLNSDSLDKLLKNKLHIEQKTALATRYAVKKIVTKVDRLISLRSEKQKQKHAIIASGKDLQSFNATDCGSLSAKFTLLKNNCETDLPGLPAKFSGYCAYQKNYRELFETFLKIDQIEATVDQRQSYANRLNITAKRSKRLNHYRLFCLLFGFIILPLFGFIIIRKREARYRRETLYYNDQIRSLNEQISSLDDARSIQQDVFQRLEITTTEAFKQGIDGYLDYCNKVELTTPSPQIGDTQRQVVEELEKCGYHIKACDLDATSTIETFLAMIKKKQLLDGKHTNLATDLTQINTQIKSLCAGSSIEELRKLAAHLDQTLPIPPNTPTRDLNELKKMKQQIDVQIKQEKDLLRHNQMQAKKYNNQLRLKRKQLRSLQQESQSWSQQQDFFNGHKKAITDAKSILDELQNKMKGSVLPVYLRNKINAFIKLFTCQRYDAITQTGKNFSIRATKTKQYGRLINIPVYDQEAIVMALRLSIFELFLDQDAYLPFISKDPFSHTGAVQRKIILDALEKASAKQQVVLLISNAKVGKQILTRWHQEHFNMSLHQTYTLFQAQPKPSQA